MSPAPTHTSPSEDRSPPDACAPDILIGKPTTVTAPGAVTADEVDTIVVGPFTIPAGSEGKVSFLDTVSGTVEGDRSVTRTWSDTCGNPAETLTVRKPIEAKTAGSETTLLSNDVHDDFDGV